MDPRIDRSANVADFIINKPDAGLEGLGLRS